MKKIALLYGHDPSGHVSAALALEEAFAELGAQTVRVDLSRDFYKRSGEAVNTLYLSMLAKTPLLWRLGYDNPFLVALARPLRMLLLSGDARRLTAQLKASGCDAAVCTHSLPCCILSIKARQHGLPIFGVVTDFSAHHFWPSKGVAGYFVHEENAARDLASRGIAQTKIHSSGIPVGKNFSSAPEGEKAKSLFGLEQQKPCILLCGGSKGLGDMETALEVFCLRPQWQVLVACGMNEALKNRLTNRFAPFPNIKISSGQSSLSGAMAAADIIVGKPGGVTCAETLAAGKPLIIFNPLPGQETRNTAFLTGQQAALKADGAAELLATATTLLESKESLAKIQAALGRLARPQAARDIAKTVLTALERKE